MCCWVLKYFFKEHLTDNDINIALLILNHKNIVRVFADDSSRSGGDQSPNLIYTDEFLKLSRKDWFSYLLFIGIIIAI